MFRVRPWLIDLVVVGLVAADGQHVVDAQVVQLDDGVFGLFAGEPGAQQVRHGVDAVAVLDDAADADGARPLLADPALDGAVGLFLVDGLGHVAGHVDEGRVHRRDLLDDVDDVAHGLAPRRRNDLEAEQGVGRRGPDVR